MYSRHIYDVKEYHNVLRSIKSLTDEILKNIDDDKKVREIIYKAWRDWYDIFGHLNIYTIKKLNFRLRSIDFIVVFYFMRDNPIKFDQFLNMLRKIYKEKGEWFDVNGKVSSTNSITIYRT